MYLKVTMGSLLFSELFNIINGEQERNKQFKKWQVENLPEFNNDVLTQRSPFYMYAEVVGWKFVGEVDIKTWQEVKDWPGYYEPKRRTKAGKIMAERILKARGQRFNRLSFFDIFRTSIPCYGRSFTVPTGFIFNNIIYMCFDDGNYKDIKEHFAGHYVEITHGEFDEIVKAYNESFKFRK